MFKHKKVIWFTILFLALLLRVYGLHLNPVGISHDDELNELLNAKSFAITGQSRPGFIAGVLTQTDHCQFVGDCVYGELGTYIQVPWMAIFPLSLSLSRLFFVLISLGIIFVTAKLFENFTKSKAIGLLTGLLIAINPWAIYYGRTSHTILASHLFYILAAYFFTKTKATSRNLIAAIVSSFLASFMYFGSKSVLPLIITWGIIYATTQYKYKQFRKLFVILTITAAVFVWYFVILKNSYAGLRIADVGTSINQTGVAIELGGKYTWAIGRQIDKMIPRVESFLGFFSPTSLFLTGQQATDHYYLSGHGYFYLIDALFLVLGLVALAKYKSKLFYILVLISIAVLPAAIKTSATSIYSHRVSLAYPLLCGIIALGIYYLWQQIPKKFNSLFMLTMFGIYGISVSYFLFVYWYRSPVEQSSRWFFQERVLTNYISRANNETNDKDIFVLSARPDGIFNSFVFYSGIYNSKDSIIEVNKAYANRVYAHNNVLFTDNCEAIPTHKPEDTIILVDQINNPHCDINVDKTNQIAHPKDSGVIFNIINDSLCSKFSLSKYLYPQTIYDFNVEVKSNEVFCKTWIINPH